MREEQFAEEQIALLQKLVTDKTANQPTWRKQALTEVDSSPWHRWHRGLSHHFRMQHGSIRGIREQVKVHRHAYSRHVHAPWLVHLIIMLPCYIWRWCTLPVSWGASSTCTSTNWPGIIIYSYGSLWLTMTSWRPRYFGDKISDNQYNDSDHTSRRPENHSGSCSHRLSNQMDKRLYWHCMPKWLTSWLVSEQFLGGLLTAQMYMPSCKRTKVKNQ